MDVDEIVDRLYELPPAEFTRERNAAATELRKAGSRDDAERVKALRKPTAAAAAVNALVRQHRREVEQFLRAAAALREAQVAGKGDLAAATERERDALEQLVRLGGEAVRQTLLAAAVDEDAAASLLEARLERELEPRGFGTLLAHAGPMTQRRPPARKKAADDRAARARLRDAREALTAAEAEERQAQRHWTDTQRQLAAARKAVEKAERDLERLRGPAPG
jgi:hypothetical protein